MKKPAVRAVIVLLAVAAALALLFLPRPGSPPARPVAAAPTPSATARPPAAPTRAPATRPIAVQTAAPAIQPAANAHPRPDPALARALPGLKIDRLLASAERAATPPAAARVRVSIARTSFKHPLVRLEQTLAPGASGALEIERSVAMVADHAVVRAAPGVSAADIAALAARLGMRVRREMRTSDLYLVETPRPEAPDALPEAIAQLAAQRAVRYAEPDYLVWALETLPDDPSFGQLYGLHNTGQTNGVADADIDAPEAWDIGTGSGGVVVGVIDTGIDYTHPDLAGNIWTNPGEIAGNGLDDDGNGFIDDLHGWDFANDDANPMDDHNHGTHVSGTIAAVGDNGAGIVGVNWRAQLMGLKFLSGSGSGSTSDAVEAVTYATMMRQRGVNIPLTSNSWGGGGFSQTLQDAIQAAGDAGMLFIAAAGNDGANADLSPHYPAGIPLDNIIAVAATDRSDALASFSTYGATTVDLGAPGVDILSTVAGGGYSSFSGTSMATPHVAGVAALAWDLNPNAGWAVIKSAILVGGDPLPSLAGKTLTGARLNAFQTLLRLGLLVKSSAPAAGAVVFEPPVDFTIGFSDVIDTATVQAGDLAVNGVAASSFTIIDATTVAFHFTTSPVAAEGLQGMAMADGAITRTRDGDGLRAWSSTFRYDTLALQVVATTPAAGATVLLPLTTLRVDFNEPIDPASADTADVALSQGSVTAAAVVGPASVEYTLSGVVAEAPFTFTLPAGALTDVQGNPSLHHVGSLELDFGVIPFPATLRAQEPPGSLIHRAAVTGAIGHPGDIDTFMIDLEAGQTLTVSLRPDAALQGAVSVTTPATGVTSESAPSAGEPVILQTLLITAPGEHAVAVSGSTSGAYTLDLILNSALAEEPNGAQASAQELEGSFIPLGPAGAERGAVSGELLDAAAEDWFTVAASPGQRFTFVLTGSEGLALDVLDAAGEPLAAGVPGSGAGQRMVTGFATSAEGPLAIRARGAAGPYTLVVTRGAAFEREPNGDPSAAPILDASGMTLGATQGGMPALPVELEPNDDGVAGGSAADLPFANDWTGSFAPGVGNAHTATLTGTISAGFDADWDFYLIRAAPGDALVVTMTGTTLSDTYLRLYDRTGKQIASNDDANGLDSRIDFSAFAYAGEYYIVADSFGSATGTYVLNAALTTTAFTRTRTDDNFRFAVFAGDTLSLRTHTPGAEAGLPDNALDPVLELAGPTGAPIATDDNSAPDGRNAALTHVAAASGLYRVKVRPSTAVGAGEYVLEIAGATGAAPALAVAAVDPPNGARLPAVPTSVTLDFSDALALTTAQAGDLMIDGAPAVALEALDGDTLRFTLPPLGEGTHTLALAPGVMESLAGGALTPFSASFSVDLTPPQVAAASVAEGEVLAPGALVFTIDFSEELLAAGLDGGDFSLVGEFTGARSPLAWNYDAATSRLTLQFGPLVDDNYTLTLRSGDGRFEDSVGNDLAGGVDFVRHFSADTDVLPFPTPLVRAEPAGSLVHTGAAAAGINAAGDVDTFTIDLDAGQTVAVAVAPASGVRPVVEISGPGLAPAVTTAPAAGQPASVLVTVAQAGLHTFALRDAAAGTGALAVELTLNAAVEAESHGGARNDSLAAAQSLEPAFTAVTTAASRSAVVGRTDGTSLASAGPDAFGYEASAAPAEFEDIEATGTRVLAGAVDAAVELKATDLGGMTFPFYGVSRTSLWLSTNGLITFGGGETDWVNGNLTSAPAKATIAVHWDDMQITGTPDSAVIWEVRGAPGDRRLIVQWNKVSYFATSADAGGVTYQAVLHEATGEIVCNYRSLGAINGGSATVGVKAAGTQGGQRLLAAFNAAGSAFVGSGKTTRIGVGIVRATSPDFFSFAAAAGQPITLAIAGPGLTPLEMTLRDAAGVVLATGIAADNADAVITGFIPAASGPLYAEVGGPGNAPYTLVVVRGGGFALEPNGGAAQAQPLRPGALLGALAAGGSDYFSLALAPGDPLALKTLTPGDGPGEPPNALDPRLEILTPGGAVAASDLDGAADGKNARLSFVATVPGTHLVRVVAGAAGGDYALDAAFTLRTPPTVEIVSPSVAQTGIPSGVGLLLEASVTPGDRPATVVWSAVSGPGAVTFESPSSAATAATFSATGAHVLRCTVSDGHFTVTDEVTVNVGATPPPWASTDIATALTGSTVIAGGTITMRGGGTDIYNKADQFRFTHVALPGDGQMVARVAQLVPDTSGGSINAWAKAGVMVRQSLAGGSANAMMAITPVNGAAFQQRLTSGGSTVNANKTGFAAPYWVKIVRSGSAISGYRSPDGTSWTQQGATATIPMTNPAFIGLALTSHDTAKLVRAVFDNISVTGHSAGNVGATVSAGAAIAADLPDVTLSGAASDDGLPAPPGMLALRWTKVSGPGEVVFTDDAAAVTSAHFLQPGAYVLRLTADDGEVKTFADAPVKIALNAATWLAAHGLDPATPLLGDGDGDSLSELLEFALGGDPAAASLRAADGSSLLPVANIATAPDGAFLELTYRQLEDPNGSAGAGTVGPGYTIFGITYQVQVSAALDGSWSWPAAELVEIPPRIGHGDGTESVRVRHTVPIGAGDARKFMRLRVSQ